MSVLHAEPAHDERPFRTLRYLAGVGALTIAYYAAGLLGLSLYDFGATALIWFPSAIALAAFVLYGIRYWPAVVLGSVAIMISRGLPVQVALVLIISNVLETCIGALVLVRLLRFRPQLDRVRDAVGFAIVTLLVTSLGATLSTAGFLLLDVIPRSMAGGLWSTWWWTHLSGDLVVTPAILTVAHRSGLRPRRQRLGILEAIAVAVASFGIVLAVLAHWLPSLMSLSTPPYYVLPMLVWAGLRFGPRGAALASLSTNVVAIVAQYLGIGPFVGLLDLQTFVTISTVGTLIVSTLALERLRAFEAAEESLRFAHDRLEIEVSERTAELRASLREKDVLLREVHHRVKNNLQVIASLLKLETSSNETAQQALVESQNRIASMAFIHQLLYQSKDFAHVNFGVYLDSLAERVAQAYGSSSRIAITVRCTLGDRLPVDQAIPCALILNELITNALTHAFPDGRSGTVGVDVVNEGDEVTMVVRDDGIGMPVEQPRMGLRIVRTLASQLGGTLVLAGTDGTTVTIRFNIECAVGRYGKIPSASHKSPS